MNEFQKPFSEKGREVYDKIFCPCGKKIGEEYQLHDSCGVCEVERELSYTACRDKYKKSVEQGYKTMRGAI